MQVSYLIDIEIHFCDLNLFLLLQSSGLTVFAHQITDDNDDCTVLQAHHTTALTGPFNIPSKVVPFAALALIQVTLPISLDTKGIRPMIGNILIS